MNSVVPRRRATPFLALVAACILLLTLWVGSADMEDGTARPPVLLPDVTSDAGVVVKTTHTSLFGPPSPDPAGIMYLPDSRTLLISDPEVNEIDTLFTGDNLFEVSLGGELLHTRTTVRFSDEPTGVSRNHKNGHYFFSDDTGVRGYYEVDPGDDGRPGTADDEVIFVATTVLDLEDIVFDSKQGHLYLADGGDTGGTQSVYDIDPGANGIFDGTPPDGDDVMIRIDAVALGARDPVGLAFNPDNGHLYILSRRDHLIAEILPDGTLVRYIDLSALNSVSPAGLAYAPASDDPTTRHLYVVDRGVDNDVDPQENDGVLYEVSFPLNVNNLPPYVDAGPDQTVKLEDFATLSGSAADDGNPDPPATTTTTWSQVSGPGTASIAEPGALSTTVSFSAPGFYGLRLTADDGQLTVFDDVIITVQPPGLLHLPVFIYMVPDGAD